MNKSDVAYLVSESYEMDDYGVYKPVQTSRKIFVAVNSVTGQEWFEGGRNGLNPQYRFTMYSFEYLGERLIYYKDKMYTIYRTYIRNKDEIELYAELRKGNSLEPEDNEQTS